MSEQMTDEKVAALRKPFDKKSVGKLPKGGTTLDYVGHAAVTDRLLAIDPLWSWEPMATDDRGLPITDAKGNLWIRLTICGVTRIGVGDGKSAKEVIGDAIRNAAMRFGVALDLWSKEELESVDHGEVYKATAEPERTYQRQQPAPPPPDEGAEPGITTEQLKTLQTLAGKLGMDRDTRLAGLSKIAGRPISTAKDLYLTEASAAIKSLSEMVPVDA